MQYVPGGWSPAKFAAFKALLETAQSYQVLTAVLTAAGDNSVAAQQLKADILNLGKAQLATLKATP